jgi:ribosomal protein S18 acetylase RimI-like enzyme/2-polyprenyl-3-methyl-5-hydroxy-6-metoxy-1,4-benzoquinol methylase
MKIRILTQEDWQQWKLLRLEALKNAPESFGSSYEEEVNWTDLDFQTALTKSDIFGIFVDNSLVSCAGFYSLNSAKTKHCGVIWGMYTRPECRGQGIASSLIQAIINHAKSRVNQLHLTCVTSNLGAVAFYQKQGFKIYGTEPRALKIRDTFFDEHLMILDLTQPAHKASADYAGGAMKQLDTYLSLCTEVYDLSKPNPPEDAYACYRDYAIKANGPILEPMCGTGRFLLPLLEEGFNVHGFDASDHMLQSLHAKAKAKNLEPMVWKGFVEDLKRPEKYNLIFIPSGSFCLIIDPSAVKAALKTLYDHLRDDGILLFEGETLKAVPPLDVWRGSVWRKPNGQMIMLSQLATMKDNVCNSIGKYELIHNNSIIHTEIEELKVRIYEQHELTEILKSCGFKVRAIKAFDGSTTPDENDESVVYECRK